MKAKVHSLLVLALLVTSSSVVSATGGSEDIERRVESILSRMTLDEKIDLLGGVRGFEIVGVPRLNIPPMVTADGPFGLRRNSRANIMAGGITLAATWNRELAERVGREMGRDARARGVHYLLAPGVNLYRSALNGRNFEYVGEDPWLASRIAVSFIRGVQSQGVAATIKHYLLNDSEFARYTTDAIVDERALREIYLPPFEAAVREANVAAVMSSYNLVNGEHLTQNRYLGVDVLKKQWGFSGVLMSDWGATHNTLGAANGGLDLEMPSGQFLNREALAPLLASGKISRTTIDDKARRILRNAIRFGWLDRPQLDPSISHLNAAGAEAALQTAREGIVLLKNEGGLLPLGSRPIKTIAVIGPNAYPAVPHGGGAVTVAPFHAVSFLEGIHERAGKDIAVHYARGVPDLRQAARTTPFTTTREGKQAGVTVEHFGNSVLEGKPANTHIAPYIDQGAPLDYILVALGEFEPNPEKGPQSVRWTAYYTPKHAGEHDLFVQFGIFAASVGYRLYVDDHLIADHWELKGPALKTFRLPLTLTPHRIVLEHYASSSGGFPPFVRLGVVPSDDWVDPEAEALAAKADVVVLAVGFDASTETEHWDRTFELPAGQDQLIERVLARNLNTIVVLTSGGGVDMSRWIARTSAVLQAWYLGQAGGTALAEIVFGDVNPSGHLPVTFEQRWEDNPAHDNYYPAPGKRQVIYREDVFVGYRGYEAKGTKPLFAFGHGLSYTQFKYANLSITASDGRSGRYTASFDVTNVGERFGATVAQVYVGAEDSSVPRPVKELKGFAKIVLKPGETQRVSLPLNGRSFSYYDAKRAQWRADPGSYRVLVGDSSDRADLVSTVNLTKTLRSNP